MDDSLVPNPIVQAGQGYISSVGDLMNLVGYYSGGRILYRGQNTDQPLLPRIAREAYKLGILNPLAVEAQLLEAFRRQSVPFLTPPYPSSDWDWLALAQHYGLPTRLLDWTANPLAGLWFAVESKPPDNAKNGVLWSLRPDASDLTAPGQNTSLFELTRTYVFQPSHITQRIASQRGWFSVHKYVEKKNKFIALENNAKFARKLERFIVPLANFDKIRGELDRLGVNRFSLFPELSSLSQSLEEEFLSPQRYNHKTK